MDDELEDRVFYQTYVSHMKILSKFVVGFSSINSPLAYAWKLCRLYLLRPEVLFFGIILLVFLVYTQAVDVWGRGLLSRLQASLGRQKVSRIKSSDPSEHGDHQFWEEIRTQSSAFALLGRRPRMEDRYIIEENINNNTGISFFAIFDGHGGEFAADFAKDILVRNIYNKIIETSKLINSNRQQTATKKKQQTGDGDSDEYEVYQKRQNERQPQKDDKENNEQSTAVQRRDSLRKSHSTADDGTTKLKSSPNHQKEIDIFTSKLNSLIRGSGSGKESSFFGQATNNKDPNAVSAPPQSFDAKSYIDNGRINFGKLITDEVLAADYKLVEAAKKTTNIAGTTALIAVLHGSKLIVANVGDSRGVMCDSRGIAIPLSFDHKPQQVRERKRIHDAGGFIAFRGVWRVAGILATSRALGDYPLKDKNLVIANPDILTFELNDHKPSFLILASDGLWDTFSNEEACTFIKEHLHEPDFGAKSLTIQSYQRGSVDNITVLVVAFKNGNYRIGQATASATEVEASNPQRNVPLQAPPAKGGNPSAVHRSNSGVATK